MTREILDTTGIEPAGDPAACRWVALRTRDGGLDLVATVIREDGRWARIHNDQQYARTAVSGFIHTYGLYQPA